MIKEAIAKVVDEINLTEAEAEAVMREMMEGQATPSQIAAYITALRMKGETVEEITGQPCEQARNRGWTALVHPQDLPQIRQATLRSGEPFAYQVDGDDVGDTQQLDIEYEPDALTIVIP